MIEDKLTRPERIRLEAIAQANMAGLTNTSLQKLELASTFEEFIVTGEVPSRRRSAEQKVIDREKVIEEACVVMHDAYETAALGTGWKTQELSQVPWHKVPEPNRATMRIAVGALLDHLKVKT